MNYEMVCLIDEVMMKNTMTWDWLQVPVKLKQINVLNMTSEDHKINCSAVGLKASYEGT